MGDTLSGKLATVLGRPNVELESKPVIVANGANGGQYFGDTTSRTGNWGAVQILADAVFDSATACNIAGLAASGDTIPAGNILFGVFTTIKLTSGSLIAYA